jgi:polar amino acid transport system permease protein
MVVAEAIVLVWALFVALVRLVPGRAGAPLRWLAVAYTDLFRGIPALLVIYLVVFGVPLAQVPVLSALEGDTQLFWTAVIAISLTYGAYVAEVYRAGLDSTHWSQTAAARSLGLGRVEPANCLRSSTTSSGSRRTPPWCPWWACRTSSTTPPS